MRLGFVQFAPAHLDRARNLATIRRLVASASAELLVLPELADTGYVFEDRDQLRRYATPADGEFVTALSALSRETGIALVTGFAERAGQRLYNAAAMTAPDGQVHLYRKAHLFDRERSLFDPGDLPFAVHTVAGARVGVMICFDWIFPEAARSLALLGAQVIAHPSNLVLPWGQRAMELRCLENGVFGVTANRTGQEILADRALVFTGASQVVSPRGEKLAQADLDGEAVVVVDLALEDADAKWITATNHVLDDRRPELYVADPRPEVGTPR